MTGKSDRGPATRKTAIDDMRPIVDERGVFFAWTRTQGCPTGFTFIAWLQEQVIATGCHWSSPQFTMTSISTGIFTGMIGKSMWRVCQCMTATVRIGEVHVQVFVCVGCVCVCGCTHTHTGTTHLNASRFFCVSERESVNMPSTPFCLSRPHCALPTLSATS